MFLKNNDYRINLEYVKEFEVNKNSSEEVFSIKIVDNKDNIKTIDINIREMLEEEGFKIDKSKEREIIKKVKKECYYKISSNDLFCNKKDLDIDDMVYDCFLSILDMYIKSNK